MGTSLIRKEWEGQVVDGRFALLEWLGGTADRDVFAARGPGGERVAIKLIAATGADADRLIGQWVMSRTMEDPGLTRVLEAGRCMADGVELVYVATEFAESSLEKKIRERALGPGVAKAMFGPVALALAHLHRGGFVHGRVKPTNILLVNGRPKLSGEDLVAAGSMPERGRKPGNYDAPELMNSAVTAANDSWGVGMCLAEAMTQQLPRWRWAGQGGPVVPETLPEPFYGIVRECLALKPEQRCEMAAMAAKLERVQAAVEEESPTEAPERRTEGVEAGAAPQSTKTEEKQTEGVRDHRVAEAVRTAEERLRQVEPEASELPALNAALAAVLQSAAEQGKARTEPGGEESRTKAQRGEAAVQKTAAEQKARDAQPEIEVRSEPAPADEAVATTAAGQQEAALVARWEELKADGEAEAAPEPDARKTESEPAAEVSSSAKEEAARIFEAPVEPDTANAKVAAGAAEAGTGATAGAERQDAEKKSTQEADAGDGAGQGRSRWHEDGDGEPSAEQKAASRWEEGSREETDARAPRERYFEYLEEPEEEAPKLFARIEDTHLGGFRLLPWLIGVVVLAAVAGGVLVRMGVVKIPWPATQQSAQKAQPAGQASPQTGGPAQPAQTQAMPQGQNQAQGSATAPQTAHAGAGQSGAQAGGAAGPGASTPQTQAQAAGTSQAGGTAAGGQGTPSNGTENNGTGSSKAGSATALSASAENGAGGRSMDGQSAPPNGGAVPTRIGRGAKVESVSGAKAAETAAVTSHPENGDGAVEKQVMPQPSQAARESMHGPVDVTLRVSVNRTGQVEYVAYVSPDEGNYFARIAWRAAHGWEFTPPYRDGRAETSVWTLRFFFERGHTGVAATPDRR